MNRSPQQLRALVMFYAVNALLATRQLGSSKHSGVLALFDREFVKPGLLPTALSRSLRLAFNRRQSWDYGEMGALDPDEITEMVAGAKLFVQAIEEFLRESGFESVENENSNGQEGPGSSQ